jgi:hypothetical protein
MRDDDDYGAVGGMRIGRGNRSKRLKKKKVKMSLLQTVEALRVARGRGSHIT